MRRFLIVACATPLLLSFSAPAWAQFNGQTPQQAAQVRTNALTAEARQYFRDAEAQRAAGDFTGACQNFKNSAAVYTNANMANIGMLTETGPNAMFDKDIVLRNGRELGKNAELADANAKAVCGKSNAPQASAAVPSAGRSSASSNTGTYTTYFPPEYDIFSMLGVLQSKLDKGFGAATAASASYQTGKYSAACDNARQSANYYSEAVIDARKLLSERFADTSTIDISRIEANSRQSAADASELYCQGQS